MNDNIQLIMEGPCKNCNECELVLDYYDDFYGNRHYDARCEYEDTCEQLGEGVK